MMREVLIFVSGVTIGGFLGYKLIEKKYNDKFETEVNRRIDEYVMRHREKEKTSESVETKKILKEEKEDKINYNQFAKEYSGSDDGEEETDDGKEDEPEVTDYISDTEDARDPYEITEDEYEDDNDSFEKESLYYYRGNYTLVDDSDNVVDVEDANTLLGPDWVDRTNNNGIVYIRNEKVGTDYELVINSGVYPL